LDLRESDLAHLTDKERGSKVNAESSLTELRRRCDLCRKIKESEE
jgi:hypothetical protein